MLITTIYTDDYISFVRCKPLSARMVNTPPSVGEYFVLCSYYPYEINPTEKTMTMLAKSIRILLIVLTLFLC